MSKKNNKEVVRYSVKYDNKKDYKILWPGDKPGADTTKKYVYINNVVLMALIFWLGSAIFLFVMLWRPLPGLPFPEMQINPFKHFYSIPWLWSWLGDSYDSSYAKTYQAFVLSAKTSGEVVGLLVRWVATVGLTLGAAYWGGRLSWTPSGGVTHKKGKELLEGMVAFLDLKRNFNQMSKYGSSKLIVGASVPFNPMVDTIEDLQKSRKTRNAFIERPLDSQKTMTIITGGTGRGKTNLIYFLMLAQIFNRIKRHHDRRLIILDTLKQDYQKYFKNKEDYYLIAPQKKMSEHWAIAKDIDNSMLAKSFMEGKIPQNEANQDIWNPAATTVGTGCIVLLQSIAPREWTLAHLSYVLNKTGEELKRDLWNVYPESQQILSGATETVASVITTLGTYKDDLMEIARLMDGFDSKRDILFSTTKCLRIPSYVDWMKKEIKRTELKEEEEKEKQIANEIEKAKIAIQDYRERQITPKEIIKAYEDFIKEQQEHTEINMEEGNSKKNSVTEKQYLTAINTVKGINERIQEIEERLASLDNDVFNMARKNKKEKEKGSGFFAAVEYLNYYSNNPKDWTWKDFVEYIEDSLEDNWDRYSKEVIFPCIQENYEEWDEIEGRKLLSIRDWITNPQTTAADGTTVLDREVLIIQPFQDSPSLTKGLIKGMLYVMNKIILGMPDSRERDISMIIDEFATYNGIESFVRESFSLWRSKGVDITIALQDFSMLEDIGYSQAFVDFLISNAGNLIIVGHNAGKTSQTMQDMLGERTISKVHKSVGSAGGGGGKSTNTEVQEHQEVVVHSSVFNELGANIAQGKIKYLYLVGKLNPAYLMEVPLIKYPSYDTGELQDRLVSGYIKPKKTSLKPKKENNVSGGNDTVEGEVISKSVTNVKSEVANQKTETVKTVNTGELKSRARGK